MHEPDIEEKTTNTRIGMNMKTELIQGAIFDMDGTLLPENKILSDRDKSAIKQFRKDGGKEYDYHSAFLKREHTPVDYLLECVGYKKKRTASRHPSTANLKQPTKEIDNLYSMPDEVFLIGHFLFLSYE